MVRRVPYLLPLRAALHPADAVPSAQALPRGGKIAVVQPLPGIGDMIWHLPHIGAIARAVGRPVTLVTKPGSAADQLLVAEPSVGDILWLRRDRRRQLVADLRAQKFDAVVLLHHSRTLAAAAALADIPARYGYGFGLQRLFLNRPPFLAAADLPLHPYMQASAWLDAAGIVARDPEPLLKVPDAATAAVRARLGDVRPTAIGIASSEPAKQWGADRFAALIAAAGFSHPILIGGNAEAALAADIVARVGTPVATAIGWPLAEVAALLARSRFYVGNDTGIANIAAAVGTRAFVLFGATPPFDHATRIVPIVPAAGVDRVNGMAHITPPQVLAALAAAAAET
jgi:heptosyltransferase-2